VTRFLTCRAGAKQTGFHVVSSHSEGGRELPGAMAWLFKRSLRGELW